jgi:hypothetical protein
MEKFIMNNEDLFDAAIKLACIEKSESDLKWFHSFDAFEPELSEEHKTDMKKMFTRDKQQIIMVNIAFVFKRILIAVMIILSLCMVACMFNKDIRNEVVRVVVTYYDKYFSVTYEKENSVTTSEESTSETEAESTASFRNMYPEYIPEGYSLINDLSGENYTNCIYIDINNNSLLYLQTIIDESSNFEYDNENVEMKKCDINGYDGILIINQKENSIAVTWNDEFYAYSITGVLSEEEVIKMAESVS